MKTSKFCIRPLILAVHSAMITMALTPTSQAAEPPAQPAGLDPSNPAVAQLTQQHSKVEMGGGYVSDDSYKFGEYNGLQKESVFAIGNIDLRGGGSYDSEDRSRWRVSGGDLGLETRNISGEYGRQGNYRFSIGYDELRRNRSDSYQTPYLGAGSTGLTLPSNWAVPVVPRLSATTPNARGLSAEVAQSNGLVSGVSTPPTPAQLAASAALIAADVPAFHNINLDTKRKRTDLGYSRNFNEHWEFKASFRREDKDGLKPMGANSRQTGSDLTVVIPDVIDQTTDQWDAGLNFTASKGFLHAGYYASTFKNNVNGMTWQNFGIDPIVNTNPNMNTISSAPDNWFHQMSLTGGYDVSTSTHLVVDAAYGRSTQNVAFLTDATVPVMPVPSADALVVSKTVNLKLTGHPVGGLQLSGGYKFDERDNRTPVNIYQFSDANQAVAALNTFGGLVVAQNANANLPYSKRVNQFNLDADYRLAKAQFLKAGGQYQEIKRWCDGSWIACVDATKTKEDTLSLEYRNSVAENLSGKIGYDHGNRTVGHYNENAFLSLVPYANVSPTGAPAGTTAYGTMVAYGLNGWGPNSGYPATTLPPALAFFFPNNNALSNALYANENRISELPGMRRYNMADRTREKLRTGLNWQASEQLALQGGLNANKDDYRNSVYGLTESNGLSVNLDASYQANEKFGITAFYTFEDQHAKSAGSTYTANSNATNVGGFTAISGGCYPDIATRNQNNKIDPCLNWSADLHDRVDTLGVALQQKGLMSGRLQLFGDLSLTQARSDTSFTGGNYINNPLAVTGAPAGTIAAFYIPATPLPTVTTRTVDLRLVANYAISKPSSVRFGYRYSHLSSDDWAYDSMQYGGLTQALPTNEMSPKYTVHVVGVSFIHTLR